MQLYRRGDSGPAVAEVQATLVQLGLLAAPEDGFGEATDTAVRDFQQRRGVSVDGIVGPETYRALAAARWRLGDRLLTLASNPYVGDDVAALQERLLELGFDAGRVDGVFGVRTQQALRGFQREYGMVADGACGMATLRALKQLGRLVTGGRPHALREGEQLHRSGSSLAGKTVVVDPGHGGPDRGATGCGLEEAAVVEDLAARFEGRLAAVGVRALLTRSPATCPTDAERAAFANEVGADLVVSLHVDRASSPRPQGVASYHFGTGSGVTSTVGEELASLVQREVTARTDLLDCSVHGKTWDLLRLTRMPAVRLELGHVTHPGDAARLADPAFRDTVAEALLVAVQRLYLPADLDPPTGVLRLPDLSLLQAWVDARAAARELDGVDDPQVAAWRAALEHPDALRRGHGPAHVTASGVVLDPAGTATLLVLHRKVGLWLQPGGHVDDADPSLAAAATREATEETGVPGLAVDPVPVALDRHPAPCGVQEHLDVQFLLVAPAGAVPVRSAESLDVRWWPAAALPQQRVDLGRLVRAGQARLRG